MFRKLVRIKGRCLLLLLTQLMFISSAGALRAEEYPRSILRMLDSTATEELLTLLADTSKWDGGLLKKHFDNKGYDPELADLVIFIDEKGGANFHLFRHGKRVERLFGAKNIFVLIFSQIELRTKTVVEEGKKKEKGAFEAKMTPLNYQRDLHELDLLSVIRKTMPFDLALKSQEKKLDPQKDDIKLERISSEDSRALYFGMKSFTLETQTKNRITVWPVDLYKQTIGVDDVIWDELTSWLKDNLKTKSPPSSAEIPLLINLMRNQVKDLKDKLDKYDQPDLIDRERKQIEDDIVKGLSEFETSYEGLLEDIVPRNSLRCHKERLVRMRSLSCTFGNYSASWFGASLALNLNEKTPHVLVHWYLPHPPFLPPCRPLIPRPSGGDRWQRFRNFFNGASYSVFGGTNIGEEFLEDTSVGLSAGHLIGYWGALFGIHKGKEDEKWEFFWGINYMLL